ncbi:DUF2231 domain-containing protein [Hymenobacter busanensis]|uniref:DUF2231 domain-containing protein n=1 Tax=Hymenobacter busanensis TaxID=2607656 RepID=UPI0014222B69|nr:DUF2231 domain-containing protein [Hymenobacter busanensis]
MFSDFPNLHPLVVHLPIVLLLLSAALQGLRVYRDWPPVKWITIGVMAGGFLGALAASTVFHAMPLGLAPPAAAVFEAHEKYAGYTMWLSGITLLLAGIGVFFKVQGRAYEILVLVSAVATAGVLAVAGHRGAQLVYVEGVGPQGRLLDKSHGHGGEQAMPGMETGTDNHAQPAGADTLNGYNAPASGAQGTPSAAPNATDMRGMEDMDSQASPALGRRNASPGGMGNMDMSGSRPAGQARPSPRSGAMPDMPGMSAPAAQRTQRPAPGTDRRSPSGQQAMGAMPGMENMPGMRQQPAGAKTAGKTRSTRSGMEGMEGMEGMADMPGMQAPAAKPPGQAAPAMKDMSNMPGMEKGQAMPATGTMPGMSMPANPLDKFRFEDNNPARNKPKNANQ